MSNVKLAIRVRPFTERELKSEKDRIPVVEVPDDNTVTITNVKVNVSGAGDSRERVRRYFADYTFDSACAVTQTSYASQEKVFETIGRNVIESVSRGSSACVLAYGQSATGKTHTMMGTDTQPGLVPRICRALAEKNPLDITVSFLEIYNERVHDLLVGEAPVTCHSLPRRRGNSRKDLRVREHPDRGPYVQNLRRVAVHDIETLLSLVGEGARRRRTAATKRNITSSRSHALLELATPRATLHLADLAGSEKASWEGCGGGRQKEGANINKSLVALSNVISALVSGGNRGRFVPYRDSALTWLLRDCFTGGASTFIIATVSPSVACYGESASTLRWAERARQLPTLKAPHCGISAATKAALQAQFNQLLAELTSHHIRYIPETGKISYDDSHWSLQKNSNHPENDNNTRIDNDIDTCKGTNTNTKIGNIIEMFSTKTEETESTASSVASGSSDKINAVDKNIKDEINKEVDKLFGPALERTKSGSDLEVIAPLRHKRRQYKSQEVLPIDKVLNVPSSATQSQERINEIESAEKIKSPPIPILYDNQRAEIVASVTERLYSKLKKKEEAASAKMESIVDKKIMEPLNELRICTNARQRLVELSQKAIRNRRRIGIPAHTQTKTRVTRVRDQGIDVQTDLGNYLVIKGNLFTLKRDAATETIPLTPRCKEIAVGSEYGTINLSDRSTLTDQPAIRKNSSAMTEVVAKLDCVTQTPIVPPPRRKKHAVNFSKYLNSSDNSRKYNGCTSPPVISINISQPYPVDSDSQTSDDNSESSANKPKSSTIATPDLLTNHSTHDTSVHEDDDSDLTSPTENVLVGTKNCNVKDALEEELSGDFPEGDCSLPRVTPPPRPLEIGSQEEMKELILGHKENMYPYNIVLSPPRERDNSKRIVKFQDDSNTIEPKAVDDPKCSDNNIKYNVSSDITNSETNEIGNDSNASGNTDSTDSSKVETGSFVWKAFKPNFYNKTARKDYVPVYNSKYKAARTKVYKEFLGLDSEKDSRAQFSSLRNIKDITSTESTDNERSQHRFRQRRQYFEDQFKRLPKNSDSTFENLERGMLDSCRSLDVTINKYETYLTNFDSTRHRKVRTPTEYLQHLVQLRKEMIRADFDNSDSSERMSYN